MRDIGLNVAISFYTLLSDLFLFGFSFNSFLRLVLEARVAEAVNQENNRTTTQKNRRANAFRQVPRSAGLRRQVPVES
jgi:hypothetical protein